jgi:hypothetical protein
MDIKWKRLLAAAVDMVALPAVVGVIAGILLIAGTVGEHTANLILGAQRIFSSASFFGGISRIHPGATSLGLNWLIRRHGFASAFTRGIFL